MQASNPGRRSRASRRNHRQHLARIAPSASTADCTNSTSRAAARPRRARAQSFAQPSGDPEPTRALSDNRSLLTTICRAPGARRDDMPVASQPCAARRNRRSAAARTNAGLGVVTDDIRRFVLTWKQENRFAVAACRSQFATSHRDARLSTSGVSAAPTPCCGASPVSLSARRHARHRSFPTRLVAKVVLSDGLTGPPVNELFDPRIGATTRPWTPSRRRGPVRRSEGRRVIRVHRRRRYVERGVGRRGPTHAPGRRDVTSC